jgi:2-isopropylmalate synthase
VLCVYIVHDMTLPDDTPSAPYDWNTPASRLRTIDVADSTLGDGLLSPSVIDPALIDKRRLLSLMNVLGLRAVVLGHPGSGPRQFADVLDLAREMMRVQLPMDASCVARATVKDVATALDVRERSGLDLEIALVLPASPTRLEAEGINIQRLQEVTESTMTFAVQSGARVVAVLEDASRTPPEMLAVLMQHLIALGANAVRLSDSVGHATPEGTRHLVRFAADKLIARSTRPVRLEWHGQSDRGLAVANALAAVDAGVDRVHASALGLGERSGTVAMELLLTNLRLTGRWPHTLNALVEYCDSAAAAFGVAIAPASPVVGANAFRTGSGAHATALVKSLRAGDRWLADTVCSAVPAGMVGQEQRIDVSPVSGLSNVRWWLSQHGYDATDLLLMRELLMTVKQTQRVATDDELHGMVDTLLSARVVRT